MVERPQWPGKKPEDLRAQYALKGGESNGETAESDGQRDSAIAVVYLNCGEGRRCVGRAGAGFDAGDFRIGRCDERGQALLRDGKGWQ